MWPGYDNLIKAQSMRKDILTRRALGGNAVAVLVEDATSFKRRQEEMRIAQEEEAARKLHEMIEHEDPYHIRHSDDFGMDNNQEIVNTMTLLERAELLEIIHEGYSSSRLLDILEAVFQEWQKAA